MTQREDERRTGGALIAAGVVVYLVSLLLGVPLVGWEITSGVVLGTLATALTVAGLILRYDE